MSAISRLPAAFITSVEQTKSAQSVETIVLYVQADYTEKEPPFIQVSTSVFNVESSAQCESKQNVAVKELLE